MDGKTTLFSIGDLLVWKNYWTYETVFLAEGLIDPVTREEDAVLILTRERFLELLGQLEECEEEFLDILVHEDELHLGKWTEEKWEDHEKSVMDRLFSPTREGA